MKLHEKRTTSDRGRSPQQDYPTEEVESDSCDLGSDPPDVGSTT